MPPAQVADALWHCLCPSFRHRALSHGSVALRRSLNKLPTPTLTRSYSSTVAVKEQQDGKNLQKDGTEYSESISVRRSNGNDHLRMPQHLEEAGTDGVHIYLHERAEAGDKIRVEKLVRTLIREKGEKPDSRHYHALLLANSDPNGSAAEVERLLIEMENEGIPADSGIYHAALKALAIHPDYTIRASILDAMQRRWFPLSPQGWHHLIIGLLRDRQLEIALQKLAEMQRPENGGIEPETYLLNLLITTFLSSKSWDEALAALRMRILRPEPVPAFLWARVLDKAAAGFELELTRFVWDHAARPRYFNPPSGTCTAVLDVAARYGDADLANDVIRMLAARSSPLERHHYEALLEAYLQADELEDALKVLTAAAGSANSFPTDGMCRPLFLYLRESPERIHEALELISSHDTLTAAELPLKDNSADKPFKATVPVLNAIVEALVYTSQLETAHHAYTLIPKLCDGAKPNLHTFNSLFRGCAKARRKDMAMWFAAEMKRFGVQPNALTYDRLILNCLEGTRATADSEMAPPSSEDALKYYAEMASKGFKPRPGTQIALVRRTCEEGRGEVWSLLRDAQGMGLDLAGLRRWVEDTWRKRGGETAAEDDID